LESKKFRELHATTWGFDPKRPIIAIFGGSQGSIRINEAVKKYLQNPESELQLLHALGSNNPLPASTANYLPLQYFHDMASIYGSADLLITRSGAVTCSELLTVARFAILIPLAHGNGEQIENARQLVDENRAVMVKDEEFDGKWLTQNLKPIVEQARFRKLESSELHLNAAERIAGLALDTINQNSRGGA
jgi:UDP-N-acetylglucosamine--N-acetylmuramyl-(pentapeptide) pyrophosphoryl-undecaprenol N-acetylglucosamine transferase